MSICRALIQPYLEKDHPETGAEIECPIIFFMPATTDEPVVSEYELKRREAKAAKRGSKSSSNTRKKTQFYRNKPSDPPEAEPPEEVDIPTTQDVDKDRLVWYNGSYTLLPEELQKLIHDKRQQMLVILTEGQCEMLRDLVALHGAALPLHMDTTHKVANVLSTSLIVPGRFGKGVVIAWAFHAFETRLEYQLFLMVVKAKLERAVPEFQVFSRMCLFDSLSIECVSDCP